MTIAVRPITTAQHQGFIDSQASASFLQVPGWAGAKAEWDSESLGWFDGGDLVGVALVLYRQVPKVKRYLAYIPEGPILPWATANAALDAWLAPLAGHCRGRGAFALKMGPAVATRRWHTDTVKKAIADDDVRSLTELPADETFDTGLDLVAALKRTGWTQEASSGAGFGDVQPRFVFQVPLADRAEDEIFSGFNQLWRRNIRKAEKLGVDVTRGSREDLALFHPVYVETAARDQFVPRGIEYFERMWDALNADDPDRMRLYLARHEGEVVAATTMVIVGEHSWYSYGASSTASRNVRPSNAIQWQMIKDSRAAGCSVYDMRGITDSVASDDHLIGLIQFKVGTGGYAQEYVGEWDLVLRPLWNKAYDAYRKRR